MVEENGRGGPEPTDPRLLLHQQFLWRAAQDLEEEVRTSTPDLTKTYCQECCLEAILEGCGETDCPYPLKKD